MILKNYWSSRAILRIYQRAKISLTLTSVYKNWPYHYVWKIIQPDYAIYKLKGGAQLKVRPATTDRIAVKEVWVHNLYFPRGFDLSHSDIVIDIGAHIGTFTIMPALKANRGMVYAFELSPDNFTLLEENIVLNRLSNVHACLTAVSGQEGKVELVLHPNNPLSHSLQKRPKNGRQIGVATTTLERIMSEHNIEKIDYLKIDCEGGEHDILYHTPPEVLRKIKKICIECEDIDHERNQRTMVHFLKQKGFGVAMTMAPYGGLLLYGVQDPIYSLRLDDDSSAGPACG